jgi:type I restriction enzyme S subunit
MSNRWPLKRLGDLAIVQSGGTPLRSITQYWESGSIPWYSSGELNSLLTTTPERHITSGGLSNSNAKLFPKGSLLIGMYDTAALKMSILDRDATFNQAIAGVKPDPKFDLIYVMHAINSIKPILLNERRGVRQKNLSLEKIKDISIPFPPLSEQKRIVAILDGAFSGIARAKEIAEKNLVNTRQIFESYLNNIFMHPGNDWQFCSLEDNVRFIDYRGRTPEKTDKGVRLITAKNVKLGYLQYAPEEFIAAENYKAWMTRGIPNYGDIIFTTEAPLANVAQIETNEKLAFAQRIIVMQPQKEILEQAFLKYLLLSSPIRKKIIEKGTGATVQGIKSRLLKKVEICFPKSLSKQKDIVVRLNSLRTHVSELENVYTKKILGLDEFKNSLLHQAFSGALTKGFAS